MIGIGEIDVSAIFWMTVLLALCCVLAGFFLGRLTAPVYKTKPRHEVPKHNTDQRVLTRR